MKRIASILSALSLAVLFGVASANAQVTPRMTATIPFEFSVGSLSLPAGQYEFLGVGNEVVQIVGADRHSVYTLPSASVQVNGFTYKSTLKFANVDGRHVLTQVWNDLSGSGSEFPYERAVVESPTRANLDGNVIDRR